jgi:hypothetical protein
MWFVSRLKPIQYASGQSSLEIEDIQDTPHARDVQHERVRIVIGHFLVLLERDPKTTRTRIELSPLLAVVPGKHEPNFSSTICPWITSILIINS